jgi:hypothetical protein
MGKMTLRSALRSGLLLKLARFLSLLAVSWAVGPLAANAASMSGAAQYRLYLTQHPDSGDWRLIGDGFFRFDAAAAQAEIDSWTARWDACYIDDDEAACEDLDYELDVEFPVIRAEFALFGHTFRDSDIRWLQRYEYDGDDLEWVSIAVEMGLPYEAPYFLYAAGGEDSVLSYEVAGNFADCHEAWCNGFEVGVGYDEDYRGFDWVEEPVPAPEPGTLALLSLGLAGIGFARRRKA